MNKIQRAVDSLRETMRNFDTYSKDHLLEALYDRIHILQQEVNKTRKLHRIFKQDNKVIRIYKEKAGVLADYEVWCILDDGYLYTGITERDGRGLYYWHYRDDKYLIG